MAAVTCPNCGRVSLSQGAHNLHAYHCGFKAYKESLKNSEVGSKKEKVAQVVVAQKETHDHTWRLLNLSDRSEQNAYRQGYKKICMDCEEVE